MSYSKYIYCPVCGEKMRMEQRNCFNCGSLNFSNPLNRNLKEYQPDYSNKNKFINRDKDNIPLFSEKTNDELATNIGNVKIFFIFNLFLLVIPLLLLTYFCKDNIISREFSFSLLVFLFYYIETVSFEMLYMKANKRWWTFFVPIYNLFCLSELAFSNKFFFIFFFIPGINIFFNLVLLYNLGRAYDRNGFITMIFPFIMIPIIGFSNGNSYNGINYLVQYKGEICIEQFYKYRNILKKLMFIVFSVAITILIFTFL